MLKNVIIWKDVNDLFMFHIGTISVCEKKQITLWTSFSSDAIIEIFGGDFYEDIKDIEPGCPVRINITVSLVELEGE